LGNYDFALLYRIAKSYYKDDLPQQEISRRENISRPHVSRMLAKARECGMVKIDVRMPVEPELEVLSEKLRERLCLKAVKLAYVQEPTFGRESDPATDIATVAAVCIPDFIRGAHTIGIGWGRTVYQASLLLDYADPCDGRTFVPLIGLSGESSPFLQINVIVDRFAEKFAAESTYTIMPAIRNRQQKMGTAEKESFQRLRSQWEKLDAAVIGLGPAAKSGRILVAEGSQEYHRQLAGSGTVGDILASFYYPDGSVFDTSACYQQISLPLSALREIGTVICVAGGQNKVDGILAAARSGYFSILITDSRTAERILEKLQREDAHVPDTVCLPRGTGKGDAGERRDDLRAAGGSQDLWGIPGRQPGGAAP
jgi:DNA-binding transcriptional regulator LsrR (DeoR family)